MEKHKVCKICNKRYSNGKALGGHMRSHLIKLPLPLTKPNSNSNSTNSKCSPPSSSSSLDLKYGKIINTPNRSQEFSRRHHDESETETETESESDQYYLQKQYSTRRRSKRRRKSSTTTVAEPSFDQQVSKYCSESAGAISVEDAAMFLMKLSRDKWEKHEKELEVEVEDDDDDGDQEEEISIRSLSNKNSMSKYRCKLCNKEFGSYHALGGHKANHKKIKNTVDELEYENDDDDDDDEEEEEEEGFVQQYNNNHNLVDEVETRRFQCPFCYKVFRSGQALGGHKKVHFSTNMPFVAKLSSPKVSDNNLFIDLNLPAVADDES